MKRFFVVLGRVLLALFVFVFSLLLLLLLSQEFFPDADFMPTWYVLVLIALPFVLVIMMVKHYQAKDKKAEETNAPPEFEVFSIPTNHTAISPNTSPYENNCATALTSFGPSGSKSDSICQRLNETNISDPSFLDAVDCIVHAQAGSVSLVQRSLKCPYARASALIDIMEEVGIVTPFNGSLPRTVNITAQEWALIKTSYHVTHDALHQKRKSLSRNVFTVFNAQTPNDENDRICSVGIVRVDQSKIIFSETFTVNPQCSIIVSHSFRHGVHDCDAVNAPLLPEIWERLEPMFYDSIIVSHNIPFHLAVLGKALRNYGISPPPVRYFDTLEYARAHYPEGYSKSLSSLCAMEGIAHLSHTALDHAQATAQLLLRMTKGKAPKRFVGVWNFGDHLYDNTFIRR